MNDLEPTNLKCPSLMNLASYLDGRLSPPELVIVERHLGECPACMAAVQEYRDMQASGDPAMTFVPPQVLTGAMALVKEARPIHISDRFVFVRRAAAIAASIVIGVGGYQVGANLSSTPQSVAADEEADYSFGLLDSSGSDQTTSDWMTLSLPEASS